MNETRLNVRLEGVMADHVDGLIEQRLYSNQSEYVRDLIRHDMKRNASTLENEMVEAILQSHEDIRAGRMIKSTGDFDKDLAILEEKQKNGWA